ncbi:MAG: hypothetical protein ACXVRJ_01125 [Gaiellaceae bacterium]
MQPEMPEVPSLPVKETLNVWLYQPFESGARAGTAVTPVGGVKSYLIGKEAVPTLPALSVQLPLIDALAESGLEYVCVEEQESMPEVESVPEKETATAWLYHPFESADRDGVAVTDGGVMSTLMVLLTVVVPPSLVAEHVNVLPVVSNVIVVASQPLVERITEPGSTTVQLSVTFVVYQPFVPSVP